MQKKTAGLSGKERRVGSRRKKWYLSWKKWGYTGKKSSIQLNTIWIYIYIFIYDMIINILDIQTHAHIYVYIYLFTPSMRKHNHTPN